MLDAAQPWCAAVTDNDLSPEDLETLARFREPTQPLDVGPLVFAKLLSLALIEQKEGGAELTASGRERLDKRRDKA